MSAKLPTIARILLGLGFTIFGLFSSIAAVVVGGTLLSGGKGSYWGTMSGALVLTLVESLLRAAQLPEAFQLMVLGAILLALELYLAWSYRDSFRGVLDPNAKPVQQQAESSQSRAESRTADAH